MATNMMAKYDKYYGNIDNINILVFVAVLLDPRHKWNYVDWIVRASYDATKATLLSLKIQMVFKSLFDSYASSMPPPKTSGATSSTSTSSIFTQSGTQRIGTVDLIELMNSRYQMETGCSLTNV
ncbi:unnamed protein product [Amaranthus hypochondriacus]